MIFIVAPPLQRRDSLGHDLAQRPRRGGWARPRRARARGQRQHLRGGRPPPEPRLPQLGAVPALTKGAGPLRP